MFALLSVVFQLAASVPAHGYDQPVLTYDGPANGAQEAVTDGFEAIPAVLDVDRAAGHLYDSSSSPVATNARPAIGFASGQGVSALPASRLQHGTAHLTEAGVLPPWRGSTSPQVIRDALSPVLERPAATFDHVLRGGTPVKGFLGEVNGQQVALFVFKEGPFQGQLATSVVPSANQLAKWGVP